MNMYNFFKNEYNNSRKKFYDNKADRSYLITLLMEVSFTAGRLYNYTINDRDSDMKRLLNGYNQLALDIKKAIKKL